MKENRVFRRKMAKMNSDWGGIFQRRWDDPAARASAPWYRCEMRLSAEEKFICQKRGDGGSEPGPNSKKENPLPLSPFARIAYKNPPPPRKSPNLPPMERFRRRIRDVRTMRKRRGLAAGCRTNIWADRFMVSFGLPVSLLPSNFERYTNDGSILVGGGVCCKI